MNDGMHQLYLEMNQPISSRNLHQHGLSSQQRQVKQQGAPDFVTSREVLQAIRNPQTPEWVSAILRKVVDSDHPERFLQGAQLLAQLIKSHLANP